MKKLFFILFLLPSLCVKAQEPVNPISTKIKGIIESLDNFSKKAAIEKVHIHFDKPYYTVGDTMWVKAYVVNESNQLSPLSKVLYVDLVNDKGMVKGNLTLPLNKGLAWGALTLGDSLVQEGSYHVRAYTTWMRNFADDYFFDKEIKIGNALASSQKQNSTVTPNNNTQAAKSDVGVQFFPEGGSLVNSINSKVAFKAIGTDGLSREISGYIVDKNNKQVATFKTEHAGMGVFMLQPEPGNNYVAVVKYNGGEKRLELPKAQDQGYVLSVSQTSDNILVSINTSAKLPQSGSIALVAQANNTVLYAAAKALNGTTFNTVIPKSRFPEGILQLTLFSPDFQPMAERLIFIQHPDSHLRINIASDKPSYKQRDKVHLNLTITDQDGKPVTGAFSLAVTDETKVPFAEENEKTIFSNLLLSSDIKGFIEKPNYYFTGNIAEKASQLDDLMLTQGWRRFVWKDILTNTTPTITYKADTARGISGRILASNGKPAANAKVFLLFDIGRGILIDTTANAEGRFSFSNFPFKKSTAFNVTATDTKGNKNLKIEIDKPTYETPAFTPLPDEQIDNSNLNTYLANSRLRFNDIRNEELNNKSRMLKEVDIKEIAVKNSSSLAGPGNADQTLTFMDLLGCQYDLSRCLEGRLVGVRFLRDTSKFFSGGGTVPYVRGFSEPMTIIVDGIERPDGLTTVMSEDVASIEVLRGGGASALYGLHGANGVIIVTTKKGDINYEAYKSLRQHNDSSKPGGLMKYVFNGYDLRREFYSPDYSIPSANMQIADQRSTIYWKPNIITNEQGKTDINFFNADGTGNYRVIIEGLDPDGSLGRQVYRYSVK